MTRAHLLILAGYAWWSLVGAVIGVTAGRMVRRR